MSIRAVVFDIGGVRPCLHPTEIIFLDDHKEAYSSAEEMGIDCIAFGNTARAIADIKACIRTNGD